MYFNSVINQSCFSTIATISKDSLEKLELFYPYNSPLIKQFKNIIISTNAADGLDSKDIEAYHTEWKKLYPGSIILHTDINKGHMFGTIDLEERILAYVKKEMPSVKYLWKSMDDVITSSEILKIEVKEADFYYTPGFSYESIIKAGGRENLHKIFETYESGFWSPQTTFFILNITNIDSLYGNDVDSKTDIFKEAEAQRPSIKPWDMPFDIKFSCETHLGRTTKDLKKYCLVEDQLEELLEMVYYHRMGDPSHKNIYFYKPGICHYHYYKDLIYNV
jgi:hypothetical protein